MKNKSIVQKIIALIVALSGMVTSFVGCSSSNSSKEETPTAITQVENESNSKEETTTGNNEVAGKNYSLSDLKDVQIWTIKANDNKKVPYLIETYYELSSSLGYHVEGVQIKDFYSGDQIVWVGQDLFMPLVNIVPSEGIEQLYWEPAMAEFETKIGKIISKESICPLLIDKYGQRKSYTLDEINEILEEVKEKLKQQENEDSIENQIEEEPAKNEEITIDSLLNGNNPKSEPFKFCEQDCLYDAAIKDGKVQIEEVSYVREITNKNGLKYLINNEQNKILLSGYQSLGEPFFVTDYGVFIDEDCYKEYDVYSIPGRVVEVIKNDKKYLVDASDFTEILAEGYETKEIYWNENGDQELKLTYADRSVEKIVIKSMQPTKSNVLVK